jgi:hypothetical protein
VLGAAHPDARSPWSPAPRAPWQWGGLGVALTLVAWLPLVYAAELVRARLVRASVEAAGGDLADPAAAIARLDAATRGRLSAAAWLSHLAPYALATFAAGWVVGRFAERRPMLAAALAGAGTSSVVLALTLAGGPSARDAWAAVGGSALAVPLTMLGGAAGRARGRNARLPR